MGWEIGQEIIDRIRCKKRTYGHSVSAIHAKYGKIYYPNYNLDFEFGEGDYGLYNEYGEKLEVFFLRDNVMANSPYRCARNFLFDRYNFGLKTHFYNQNHIVETMGKPDRKYALLVESEAIAKSAYNLFLSIKV